MQQFTKYKSPNRSSNDANQSEIPVLHLSDTLATIGGYQQYTINRDARIQSMNAKLNDQWKLLSTIDLTGCESLIDLGCSNGCLGIRLAHTNNIHKLYLLDHDIECIDMLNTLLAWLKTDTSQYIANKYSFGKDILPVADIIVTLSTIHWFYSATAEYGCLFKIIENLSQKVRRTLIIEWIDPTDTAIKYLHHVSFNSSVHKTPYTKDNFIKALNTYFGRVNCLGNTTPTRELYIATTPGMQ